jgi:hypothetical protein
VWLGARRKGIETTHGANLSQKEEAIHKTEVKGGLEGPLSAGSVKLGGGQSRAKTSVRQDDKNIASGLSSVNTLGGELSLSGK